MKWNTNISKFIRGMSCSPAAVIEWPSPEQVQHWTPEMSRLLLAMRCCHEDDCSAELAAVKLPAELEELKPEEALRWCEVRFPVAVTTGSGRIVTVLLGLLKTRTVRIEKGEWLQDDARDTANKVLRNMLPDGKEYGFVLFCLQTPAPASGNSLGLALAVAARCLMDKKPLPSDVVMTGAVNSAGEVAAVGHVPEKYEAACCRGKRLMLCPESNLNSISQKNDTLLLGVSSVTSACAVLEVLYQKGQDALKELEGWRTHPDHFLEWIAGEQCKQELLTPLMALAEKEHWEKNLPFCLKEAMAALNKCLNSEKKEVRHACGGWLKYFTLELIRNLPSDIELMRLISKHITRLNHMGSSIQSWKELGDRCYDELSRKSTAYKTELEVHIARILISFFHNSYTFDPELFKKGIYQKWLKKVDFRTDERLEEDGFDSNLGECCGFLCQHKAFCGEYGEALEYARRSKRLFPTSERFKSMTEKEQKRSKGDIQRRHIDRVYIYLDMGKKSDAEFSLCAAMEADDIYKEMAGQSSNSGKRFEQPFVHAAFVRYCRECGIFPPDYDIRTMLDELEKEKKYYHPWQLWSANCGWICMKKDPDLARRCFEYSIRACHLEEEDQVTLHPMALLGLCGLWEMGDFRKEKTEKVLRMIGEECAAERLCAEHFRPLLDVPAEEALQMVKGDTARFFPFNYR